MPLPLIGVFVLVCAQGFRGSEERAKNCDTGAVARASSSFSKSSHTEIWDFVFKDLSISVLLSLSSFSKLFKQAVQPLTAQECYS
jgi:hypothetical protein